LQNVGLLLPASAAAAAGRGY